jgi:CHRD domain
MRKLILAVALVVAASLTVVAAVAIAGGGNGGQHKASLDGYQETTGPGSISTTGNGRLKLRIRDDGIHFRLRYSDIEGGTVTQAHIHFAQRHVAGGIIAFLCGGAGPEGPCDGDIEGVIQPSEIRDLTAQGIEPGAAGYPEALRAIRAGATYANVHTTRWPAGEIRGQINRGHRGGRD